MTATTQARGDRVWWPAASPGCVLLDEWVHAYNHATQTVACGAGGDGTPIAQTFADAGYVVCTWPPYQTSEVGPRCRDCWEQTGRPRPSHSWRDQ